jgi:hypothetical protein
MVAIASDVSVDISLAHRSRPNDSKSMTDGRLRYRFKKPPRDCTDAVFLEPLDFIARLAALVPSPRFHMHRYHGVLTANAKVRAEVVPKKPIKKGVQLPLLTNEERIFAPFRARNQRPI